MLINYDQIASYNYSFEQGSLADALPARLRGIRRDDIQGYFDLTKVDRVEAFAREVRELLT